MKKHILIIFAIIVSLINLTGCGGHNGHNNYSDHNTMSSVKVTMTQNGSLVNDADVLLYTPAAAIKEGFNQTKALNGIRASANNIGAEGVYVPNQVTSDGKVIFNVPSGEYVLIAEKGNSKAVVAGLRASESEVSANVVLTPKGEISGSVYDKANQPSVGALVFLENTSCVAVTDSEGKFTLTGVPTDVTYNISAINSEYGKRLVAKAESIMVSSSELIKQGVKLTVDAVSTKDYIISGSVTGGEAGKVVLAFTDGCLSMTMTDNAGNFAIPVKQTGNYLISTLENSLPPYQAVNVNGDCKLETSFVFSSNNVAYGAIRGTFNCQKLILPQDFEIIRSNNDIDEPKTFVIRVIGEDETSYSTQVRLSANEQADSIKFEINDLPVGTYTVFYDPINTGFAGLVQNISVEANKIQDIEPRTLERVKPFVALAKDINENLGLLVINKNFDNVSISLDNQEINTDPDSSDTLDNQSYKFWGLNTILDLEENQKYDNHQLNVRNSWSLEENKFVGDVQALFDFNASDRSHSNIGKLITICYSGSGYRLYKRNNDNSVVYIKDKASICYINKDNLTSSGETVDTNINTDGVTIYDHSEKTVLYKYNNNCIYTKKHNESHDSGKKIELPDESLIPDYGSIIANRFISINCIDKKEKNNKIVLYGIENGSYNVKNTLVVGNTIEFDDTPTNVINSFKSGNLALSLNGYVYMAVLKPNSVEIHNLDLNTDSVVCANVSGATEINDFQVLSDGNFYIETNNVSYSGVIIDCKGNVVDKSVLPNRKKCFVDKNGYLYRYDSFKKSIIKVCSLDGEIIDSIDVGNRPSSDCVSGLVDCFYDDGNFTIYAY